MSTGKDPDDSIPRIRTAKKGGQMLLKASRTITLHDVSLKEIYDKLLAVLKEAEEEER